jgi:hypothetical protein
MDAYELAHDYAILKTALLTISQEFDCMGPGCPYCEDGDGENHPFSGAAKQAQKALSEVKI